MEVLTSGDHPSHPYKKNSYWLPEMPILGTVLATSLTTPISNQGRMNQAEDPINSSAGTPVEHWAFSAERDKIGLSLLRETRYKICLFAMCNIWFTHTTVGIYLG